MGHHPPQGPGILASEAPSTSCEKQHSVHVSVVFSTALTSRDLYFLLVLRLLLKHKLCGLGPHWSLSCPHTHVPGTWQDCGPCTSSHRVPWADVAPLLPCPWWAGPTSLLTAMWPGAACHPPPAPRVDWRWPHGSHEQAILGMACHLGFCSAACYRRLSAVARALSKHQDVQSRHLGRHEDAAPLSWRVGFSCSSAPRTFTGRGRGRGRRHWTPLRELSWEVHLAGEVLTCPDGRGWVTEVGWGHLVALAKSGRVCEEGEWNRRQAPRT